MQMECLGTGVSTNGKWSVYSWFFKGLWDMRPLDQLLIPDTVYTAFCSLWDFRGLSLIAV